MVILIMHQRSTAPERHLLTAFVGGALRILMLLTDKEAWVLVACKVRSAGEHFFDLQRQIPDRQL